MPPKKNQAQKFNGNGAACRPDSTGAKRRKLRYKSAESMHEEDKRRHCCQFKPLVLHPAALGYHHQVRWKIIILVMRV